MDSGGKFTLYSSDFSFLEENYTYNESYEYGESCCGTVCGQEASMAFEAIFIPILYSLAVVIGLLGNGLVLVVLWQKKRTWSVTDTFVFHLSVADILLLLTMPLRAVEAANEWIFGKELCKLTGALFEVNFYCGIFLLACISLDRYLSIVHAVQMYSRKKPWLIQLSCMAVWFFSLLLSIPDWLYLVATEDSRRGKTECVHWYPSDGLRLASRWLYHVVGFLIPALVLLFCYTCILQKLQSGSQGLQKQRAMRVILALVVAFFICWTPYNITLLVDTIHTNQSNQSSNVCDTTTALDIALTTTSTLGYLHCCMNPVLYAFVGVKFRRHLLDMARPISSRLKGRVSTVSRRTSMWSESADTSHTSAF
ncbi:C-X-C chemokine receptor type 3-like [Colossoma macropomum]|uniref:C-X-C chemokine receptor type 3-like n=1 Tax=Colossoma macropomum TaxID=42526 RepID=UPI0018640ADB|nr:C-X-C chemokine receptor type 3-like [Colossoma macropomum]